MLRSFAAVFGFAAVAATQVHALIGTAYQMQLGNPSNATATTGDHVHYLIQRNQYAMDYNDTKRVPNWVSWDLTTEDVGSSGRSSFTTDPGLPAGFTVVGTGDYSGSGYDRGHMCPSADRTVDAANNQIVFYMTNMVPQAPDNNQGVWANFETYCRTLASQNNELLITCGGSNYTGSSIASGVAVPGNVWKIVLVVPRGSGMAIDRITPSTRVIAIKIPNIQGVRSDPWTNYVTSIAQIEADTGFSFLTAVPSSIANVLRTKVDGQTATGMPLISVQPGSQTVTLGGAVTFTVTATGDAPLSYQWSRGDTEISGATGNSLTLSPVRADDAGAYTVTVSNNVGSITSNAAVLDITGIPPVIAAAPSGQTISAGSTAIFNVVASGSATLGYQWRKNTQALANGGNIAGANSATLTITNAQSADAGVYDVVVTNSVNSTTSAAAALLVNAAAPTLTTQPASASVLAGSTATFTVAARGTTPFTYQWSKDGYALTDGGKISGATTATLRVDNVGNAELGTYSVTVSNGIGLPATSGGAALTLKTVISGQLGYSGGTYTQNFDTLPSSGSFTFAGAGPHALDASPVGAADLGGWHIAKSGGSGTNALFNVGTGSSNSGSVYSFGVAGANSVTDRALGSISSGTTISRFGLVLVNTSGHAITQFTLSYIGEEWRNGGNTAAQDLIFEYAVGATNLNTGAFTGVSALKFTSPTVGSTAGALDGNANANRTAISATVTGLTWNAGQTLVLRWNDANDAGNDHALAIDDLSFTTPDPVPGITTSPSARTVIVGGSTTLTVAASGHGLTYQWRKSGQPITDNATANMPTLILGGVTLSDAGDYDVVVTNSGGSVTSEVASVTVLTAQQSWRQANFGTTADTGNAADNADPDGDGVANLLEYALGLNPNSAASAALPTGTLEGGRFVFRFTRPASTTDLAYVVETSPDLITWAAATTSAESSTSSMQTLVASLATSATKQFARLRVGSIATVPVGYLNLTLAGAGATTTFGLPLEEPTGPAAGLRATRVESLTATTIANAAGGWAPDALAAPSAPWAVRFTKGAAAGRLVDIGGNTATSITLKNFNPVTSGVVVGDTFEVVAIDTLETFFGTTTLTGGATAAAADQVKLYGSAWVGYFQSTSLGYWRLASGPTTNYNKVALRPTTGLQVLRRGGSLTLPIVGRVLGTRFVASVANAGNTLLNLAYPMDTTLGALAVQNRVAGWRNGTTSTADQVSLYNGTAWVSYVYNGAHWQTLKGGALSDAVSIPAGSALLVTRPGSTAGTTDFVQNLPY